MAKKAKAKHPFLFYGHEPGDWAEGPQLWLLRFEERPGDETQAELGRVAADELDGQPLALESFELADDGPWAATISEESEQEPFAAAGKLFRALHELAPVAEVILATAREPGYSGWDSWTEKQQALPSAIRGVLQKTGDEQLRIDTHFRTRGTDDDYPARCEAEAPIPVSAATAFEEAYRARRDSLFRAELEQALAKATKSGKPALLPAAPGVSKPALPPELAERIGPHVVFGRAASGRVVAVAPGVWPYHLAVLDPGAEEVRRIEVKQELSIKYVKLSPGGGHVLLVDKRDLVEIDLESGEPQRVFQIPGNGLASLSADYLDSDDRVLAHWNDDQARLLLRDGTSRELDPVASVKVKGVNMVTMQGRLGFVTDDRCIRLVGVAGEKIAVLGSVPIPSGTIFEVEQDGEQKIFIRRQKDGLNFEIFNLEAAYEKKLGKK